MTAAQLANLTPLVVSYGGGINSTAMLVGMVERGVRPDAILFADTGGEHPETYAFVQAVNAYCVANGLPPITTVRYQVKRKNSTVWDSLEQECREMGRLPSLAYGWHKCAAKWKAKPQIDWLAAWPQLQDTVAAGQLVRKAVGFHVNEARRRKDHIQDPGTVKVYPLIEWGWTQKDCFAAITRAGLPPPRKSACFFCPASTKHQVRALAKDEPELFARALAIEDSARAAGNLQTVVGLGRHWTWREVVEADDRQCKLFSDPSPSPCGCWDGTDNEDEED